MEPIPQNMRSQLDVQEVQKGKLLADLVCSIASTALHSADMNSSIGVSSHDTIAS